MCRLVEAAGGGGLQLFVDAGTPVDSELIRQYVNEVLADIISVTLGQREAPREDSAPDSTQIINTQEVNEPTHDLQQTDTPCFIDYTISFCSYKCCSYKCSDNVVSCISDLLSRCLSRSSSIVRLFERIT